MVSLCHSDDVTPSDALLDAGMRAIFEGLLALEAEKSRLAELGIDVNPFTGAPACLHPATLLIPLTALDQSPYLFTFIVSCAQLPSATIPALAMRSLHQVLNMWQQS